MAWCSVLSKMSIFGDVVDASLPVDDPPSDCLYVGVLVAVVECPSPKSKLDGVVGHSMPVGVAGGVLLDADAEVLEVPDVAEVSEGGVEVIVDVELVLGKGDEE